MSGTLWGIEEGIALALYTGVVRGRDLVSSTRALIGAVAWRPGNVIIRDFTRAPVLALEPGDVEALVAFKARHAEALRGSLDVWVMWRDTREPVGLLHETVARLQGMGARTCATLGEALAEVGLGALPDGLAGLYGRVGA